jgi:hypothetical protein
LRKILLPNLLRGKLLDNAAHMANK